MKKISLLLILALWYGHLSAGKPAFAEIFGEGMVLQRGMSVNVWGTADPDTEVSLELLGEKVLSRADAQGNWKAVLPELAAGGPYKLTLSDGKQTATIDNVYIGEVWIAGGQSNMGYAISQLGEVGKEAIAQASNYDIRFVTIPKKLFEGEKISNDKLEWNTATADNIMQMSGVAYFFADKLQAQIGVPLGIVITPHGGSVAETWLDKESLRSNPVTHPILERYEQYIAKKGDAGTRTEYDDYLKKLKEYNHTEATERKTMKKPVPPEGPYNRDRPGGLYQTMLGRAMPFTARGAIWYQGESNNARAEQYRTLLPMVIDQWRKGFENLDMYFYIVQLTAFRGPKIESWPEIREAQMVTAENTPKSGLVVTIDAGEKDDIHPKDKRPVGERLAALAANDVYGITQPHSGPRLVNTEVSGNRMILTFDTGAGSLSTKDGKPLEGFVLAGPDMKFMNAQAHIDGNTVIVWAQGIAKPTAVRYGWANWIECNLFNEAGFPASPFRTDNLPLITAGKY